MALNDYDYIVQKIRNVTGRRSENQLSSEDIRDYINSFIMYDLPLHSRLFYNRQVYQFQFTPDVGIYPLTSFKNEYSNFEPPCYVDGYETAFFQDEQQFYRSFPNLKFTQELTTGSDIAGAYTGTYTYTPIKRGTVVISAVDSSGDSLTATDSDGVLEGDVVTGNIDYDTGAVTNLVFTNTIDSGTPIYISADRYVKGRPYAVLYFNNAFTFYPYPDKAYTFSIVAYKSPEEFLSGGGSSFPELKQWADTIAYGASLKIFEDNLDDVGYSKAQVFFDKALRLAGRRTLQQLSTQRVSTIFEDRDYSGWSFWDYPYGG
jgi:hypothetical protein